MKYILLCLVNVVILAAGQILFKVGVKDKVFNSVYAIIKTVFSPPILSGLTMYVFSSMLWLYILNKMPLSHVYPIQALAFPLVLILTKIIFDEHIPTLRWVGIIIILFGVALVAVSEPK